LIVKIISSIMAISKWLDTGNLYVNFYIYIATLWGLKATYIKMLLKDALSGVVLVDNHNLFIKRKHKRDDSTMGNSNN